MYRLGLIITIVVSLSSLGISASASKIQSINISPPDFTDVKKTKELIHYFNDLLKKSMPKELRHIRLIELSDIKDSTNKKYYEEQAWFSFVQDDFNSNGFEDVALACIDDNNAYVVIFEKQHGVYKLVTYFTFSGRSDIFVQFMNKRNSLPDRYSGQNFLSVGFQGNSGDGVTIQWIKNKYQITDYGN